jgi:hypothetical protein
VHLDKSAHQGPKHSACASCSTCTTCDGRGIINKNTGPVVPTSVVAKTNPGAAPVKYEFQGLLGQKLKSLQSTHQQNSFILDGAQHTGSVDADSLSMSQSPRPVANPASVSNSPTSTLTKVTQDTSAHSTDEVKNEEEAETDEDDSDEEEEEEDEGTVEVSTT